jgi:hypothetical protein
MGLEDKVESRLMNLKKWGKRALIGAVIALSPLEINTAAIGMAYGTNNWLSHSKKAAVFCSGEEASFAEIPEGHIEISDAARNRLKDYKIPAGFVTAITDFLFYAPVTLRQNLEGNHAEWFNNSKKEDAIRILQDPGYTTIIVIGHGTDSSFHALDGAVTSLDLESSNIPKKEALIQHTCGRNYGMPSLRKALRAEGGYSPSAPVTELQNYASALKLLFNGY